MGKHTCCLSTRASAKILGSHIKTLHSGICRHIRSDRVKGNWEGRMKQCAMRCWSAHFPEFTSPMETDGVSRSSDTLFYCQRVTIANTQRQRGRRNSERDWLRPWRQIVLPDRQKAWETKTKGLKTKWKSGKPGCGSLCKFSMRALVLLLCF